MDEKEGDYSLKDLNDSISEDNPYSLSHLHEPASAPLTEREIADQREFDNKRDQIKQIEDAIEEAEQDLDDAQDNSSRNRCKARINQLLD